MFQLPNLSKNQQGIALVAIGAIILLLHLTGVITKSLSVLIFLGAIALIVFGFIQLDGYNRLMHFFKKKNQ